MKRTGKEVIRLTGNWHRTVSVEEAVSWKGWPAKAVNLASWEQLQDIATDILSQESSDHQDYVDGSYYD